MSSTAAADGYYRGARALDIGTGSGVLAIAAVRLGAALVVGIDNDPDALASARENLELNGVADRVELRQVDVERFPAGFAVPFDVVTANLTGALIGRIGGHIARLWRNLDT